MTGVLRALINIQVDKIKDRICKKNKKQKQKHIIVFFKALSNKTRELIEQLLNKSHGTKVSYDLNLLTTTLLQGVSDFII